MNIQSENDYKPDFEIMDRYMNYSCVLNESPHGPLISYKPASGVHQGQRFSSTVKVKTLNLNSQLRKASKFG